MPAILESLALAVGFSIGGNLFRFHIQPVRPREEPEREQDTDD